MMFSAASELNLLKQIALNCLNISNLKETGKEPDSLAY